LIVCHQIETKEDIATAQRRRAAEAEKAQAEQEADSIRSYLEKVFDFVYSFFFSPSRSSHFRYHSDAANVS
jgi:hypothetical protein